MPPTEHGTSSQQTGSRSPATHPTKIARLCDSQRTHKKYYVCDVLKKNSAVPKQTGAGGRNWANRRFLGKCFSSQAHRTSFSAPRHSQNTPVLQAGLDFHPSFNGCLALMSSLLVFSSCHGRAKHLACSILGPGPDPVCVCGITSVSWHDRMYRYRRLIDF